MTTILNYILARNPYGTGYTLYRNENSKLVRICDLPTLEKGRKVQRTMNSLFALYRG